MFISLMVEIKLFPPRREINIISYNIHSGLNKNMFPTLFDTIDFLKQSNADIICLQEVNESARAGFQVSSFKEELKMNSHFGANVVDLGFNYGLVTYSKYPIKGEEHIYLSSFREQRGMLHTVVKVDYRKLNINQGGVTVEDDILKDVAKELGKSNILTFPTGLDRIDYIFVSSNIEVIDYDVIIKDMSDHYPVFAKIKI